jgi:23S rRNA (cytosine1962-C5)-methyltransferase
MKNASPRLRLRLSPAAERAVRGGHPWVFSDSVREQNREGLAGELAVIYSRDDRFLAVGLYDPESPMRVRILHAGKPVTLDAGWWAERLRAALAKREGRFGPDTTGYRLINGESDGWPGLVLDRYADTLVLKLYSAVWLPRLEEVLTMVEQALAPGGIVLRLSRNIAETAQREFGVCEDVVRGASAETVVFQENGLRFESEVQRGQKTGFFLDQRDNRRRAGELARGADVLNAFSFSGGFSLYAARGGAHSVTDLDISRHALDAGGRNFALNAEVPSVAACRRETVQADAFEWLAQCRGSFDLVIVDPPSLAKREAERAGAILAYERLAKSALRCVRPGGVLVAASCSAHVSAAEFFNAVERAAEACETQTLWTSGHAPDHAATFREAEYLKCVALRVERGRN